MKEEKPAGNSFFGNGTNAVPANEEKVTGSFSEKLSSKSNQLTIPQISLPKGGGAVKGIDEKFSVNAANGTAAFSIPLPLSAGRNGFQPALALSYNSGAGNSATGQGWNIDHSSIQRKTDRKIPQYADARDSDVFLFSGAEDLVPEYKKGAGGKFITGANGDHQPNEFDSPDKKYSIKTYRPRIEGGFARIERISRKDGSPFYWKVTTKENTVTFFGRTAACRVADPVDPDRVFQWLPEISFDDKGNILLFAYKQEDGKIGATALHDRNRFDKNGRPLFTQQYLKKIRYGNKQAYYPDYVDHPGNQAAIYDPPIPASLDFFFEVVLDYGEHGDAPLPGDDTVRVSHAETGTWATRHDAFSSFRSGFDIRTYRLCKRILIFHVFEELAAIPCLVRSLDLEHASTIKDTVQDAELTYLLSVQQTGYTLKSDGSYGFRSLPKTGFAYQPLHWNKTVHTLTKESLVNDPVGLSGGYQWADLFGEGISGILMEQAGAWYYKSNYGNGEFTPAKQVTPKPSFRGLFTGELSLQDLDADGNKQIVSHGRGLQGFFELTDDNEWLPFEAFRAMPNINLTDPGTRLVDLDGDGKADLLLTEESAFRWYPSKGKLGYDSPELAPRFYDEDRGPAMLVNDDGQSIFLADMNGDGLTDIVRIRNGEICYWPNKGYGMFGNKITMDHSPLFDLPDQFNAAYLHLADISGTGATDIIYLGKNKFSAWINLSGNAWSRQAYEIDPFFPVELPNTLSVVDLLGNGTACIVWSSPLPGNAHAPMRYIDLMGGRKPHVMVKHRNNLGKETSLEYKSSSQFYVADKKAGKPWVTKLPFPVQCVSKLEVVDLVTDLRFVNKYIYHHGYYDHEEREFRGFGMVEQVDTEEYEYLKNAGAVNASSIEYHEHPVLTKTWFHTGAYLRKRKILGHYEHEYWYQDKSVQKQFGDLGGQEPALPDALFKGDITVAELAEAHRACKGMVLRQEVFALDGSDQEKLPFSVATHNCHIRLLQPKSKNPHAVFLSTESEAITFTYERNVQDARIAHSLTLEIDDMGNVLQAAAVVYPRKHRPAEIIENKIWNEQNRLHIILTEAAFTKDMQTPVAYRLRLPYQTKTYELKLKNQPAAGKLFAIGDINTQATELPYEAVFKPSKDEKRLIEQVKTIYLKNDLQTRATEGEHDTLGVGFESYQLAFTGSLIDDIYNKPGTDPKVDASRLIKAKYVDLKNDGHWWIRSGTMQYIDIPAGENDKDAAGRFYLPLSYTDPFGSVTRVTYYKDYHLLVQQTKDALDNTVSVSDFDFRLLAPRVVKDMNGNLAAAAVDTLGLVTGTAIMGKGGEADDLASFTADLSAQEVQDFFTDPFAHGRTLLQHATTRLVYDFSRIPCCVGTVVREEHHAINPNPALQYSFEYTGGLGNTVLVKVQAEPGDAPHRNPAGKLVKKADGTLDLQPAAHRWVGNGRAILNNKGKPVKQYEPYFSNSHLYEAEPELRETGVTPILHYDAAGRLVKTRMPDGTFSSVEYDAWVLRSFDQNDNCKESDWFKDRVSGSINTLLIQQGKDPLKEKEAAAKAEVHDNTPSVVHTDSLGRPFYAIDHNRFVDFDTGTIKNELHDTQSIFDIEGNLLSVTDARGHTVMQYKYDMLGHQLYQKSMDAGERWLLNDCMGKPTFAWDSKDHRFESSYDQLHRPLELTVTELSTHAVIIFEKFEYVNTKGQNAAQLAAQQALNLVGKAITHYDTAGIVRLIRCDFKNNTLESSRQLCHDPTKTPDWKPPLSVSMENETFVSATEFDALNRPVKIFTPHTPAIPATVIVPSYNEANLLNAVSARLRGSNHDTPFVQNIDYDAKGQRQFILYGNNTVTKYTYDPQTFRLLRLFTTRNTGTGKLQDLNYTYDPVGNITYIKDDALQSVFFNNRRVDPDNDFVYDSLCRLIQAKGREHIANNTAPDAYDAARTNLPHKGDGNQLQQYTQRYKYDKAGNMLLMHNVNSWSRSFEYSLLNNQLLSAPAKNDTGTPFTYKYDVHGNMINMPHLPAMDWNFKDELQHLGITASTDNDFAVQAHYVYDAAGQRIRKLVRKGNVTEERIYLGGFEIFRKRRNGVMELERETLQIMDDTRRIALVETKIKTNHTAEPPLIRYQYTNHLGTAALELDGSLQAAIISYEEYYPYGSTSYQATDQMREVPVKRYRYTGKERDEESGLEYHGARYYAGWLGRWVSCDPVGIADGVNVYCYTKGNPIIKYDPTGTAGEGTDPYPSDPSKGIAQSLSASWKSVKGVMVGAAEGTKRMAVKTVEGAKDLAIQAATVSLGATYIYKQGDKEAIKAYEENAKKQDAALLRSPVKAFKQAAGELDKGAAAAKSGDFEEAAASTVEGVGDAIILGLTIRSVVRTGEGAGTSPNEPKPPSVEPKATPPTSPAAPKQVTATSTTVHDPITSTSRSTVTSKTTQITSKSPGSNVVASAGGPPEPVGGKTGVVGGIRDSDPNTPHPQHPPDVVIINSKTRGGELLSTDIGEYIQKVGAEHNGTFKSLLFENIPVIGGQTTPMLDAAARLMEPGGTLQILNDTGSAASSSWLSAVSANKNFTNVHSAISGNRTIITATLRKP